MEREWEPPKASLAVDLVVFTVRAGALHVLMVERGTDPYRGWLALPGGFVESDEDTGTAAARELEEETSIPAERLHLEQLRTYATPGRDPRGRIVSVAYLAIAPHLPHPRGGSDAARAEWVPVDTLVDGSRSMAFDHADIVRDGLERARSKLEYTTLATAFCAKEFTLSELRAIYEAVWDLRLDPRNFRRKVLRTVGFVVPAEHTRFHELGRPAQLYARGGATVLHPAIPRSQ